MILAVLQARVSSSRLPGKVLKKILGKPMLQLQLERLGRVKRLDKIVVATSREISDDPIEKLCQNLNVSCFRGSLDDVLDRYYQSALVYQPDHIVRVTGDCPLTDPVLIDDVIQFYLEENFDYVMLEKTFPHGLDLEIFPFSVLLQTWENAELPSQREHVTLYMRNSDKFHLGMFKGKKNLSYLRWTVDEPEDFEFVQKVYHNLYSSKPNFTTQDILNLLKRRPDLLKINEEAGKKWEEHFHKSLQNDQI